MMFNRAIIKFKNQDLERIRGILLSDLSVEKYGCLIGKTEIIDDHVFVMIYDYRFPKETQIKSHSIVSLNIDGKFVQSIIEEMNQRVDVDTLIEVHTHPFSKKGAHFSSVDDQDERNFSRVIQKNYPLLNYGSIVFSQKEYSARLWKVDSQSFEKSLNALIITQKPYEQISSSNNKDKEDTLSLEQMEILHRSELLFGRDNIKKITNNQTITIVGVGGIGSVVAENLIHMGFNRLILCDHDQAELSNLNRLVGLTYEGAKTNRLKVDIVKEHLLRINPDAHILSIPKKIEDIDNILEIALSSWIIMATDNHYSRFLIQKLCFKYFIPFIHVGVNISFIDGKIHDMSGETIVVRMGDQFCLSCLNKLKPNEIHKVLSHDPNVRSGLVHKGYVTGLDIKEPAVKTLNAIMGSITVDALMNEYTNMRENYPITVYENNKALRIYNDDVTIKKRKTTCSICRI